MPARAPILRTKNLQRTGNLRTYFRGTLDPNTDSLIDLGVPRNQYGQENLSIVSISGTAPWMNTIKRAFRSLAPANRGDPEGSLTMSRFIPPNSNSALVSTATDTFSFCMRVKFNSFVGTADDQILFLNGQYLVDGYALVAHGDNDGSNQYLYFVVGADPTPAYFQVSNDPLSTDTWYTIGVLKTTGAPPMIFINGILQTNVPGNTPTILTPDRFTSWFNEGKNATTGFTFIGDLAEFIFYDSALDPSYFTTSFPTAPFG